MDLLIGRNACRTGLLANDKFPTILCKGDYNRESFHWSRVEIIAVFFGQGTALNDLTTHMMSKFESNSFGWYAATPGQITDAVHEILSPHSRGNTRMRSVDLYLALYDGQRNAIQRR